MRELRAGRPPAVSRRRIASRATTATTTSTSAITAHSQTGTPPVDPELEPDDENPICTVTPAPSTWTVPLVRFAVNPDGPVMVNEYVPFGTDPTAIDAKAPLNGELLREPPHVAPLASPVSVNVTGYVAGAALV